MNASRTLLLFSAFVLLLLVACATKPESVVVRETVIAEVPATVEVTRLVEVTRIVYVEVTPTTVPIDPTAPCDVQSPDYKRWFDLIWLQWNDAVDLAGQTPRASLSGVIASLQTIHQEVVSTSPPDCAQGLHTRLRNYMGKYLDSILLFAGGSPFLNVSGDALASVKQEYKRVYAIDLR